MFFELRKAKLVWTPTNTRPVIPPHEPCQATSVFSAPARRSLCAMRALRPTATPAIAATRLLRSWFAILMGLSAALVVTTAGAAAVMDIASGSLPSLEARLIIVTLGAIVLAVPVAVVSALLALPLLAFRRLIVGAEPPYVRPGYVGVALFGPALMALLLRDWDPGVWVLIVPYEVTAFIAIAIYVRLAEPLELFPAPEG